MDYKGIDISQWQGNVDWQKVKQSGIQFAILRDGYGRTEDPRFRQYVTGATKAGMPIRGTYHFIYSLTEAQAIEEAECAVRFVKEAGLPDDTYIFCDFEYDTERYMRVHGVTPTKDLCTRLTRAFCKRIIERGYRTGIYLNQDYSTRMYTADIQKAFQLWLADYEDPEAFACLVRQYSSSGAVNGIAGNVDMDIWHGGKIVVTKARKPHIEYAVKTKHMGIMPFVKNGKSIGDDEIVGVAIKAVGGQVKYRVHTVSGRWLGEITGCDWDDYYNGWAGNGRDAIDAIQIYFQTDAAYTGGAYYACRYRVKPVDNSTYYSWVTDTNWEPFDGNGTSGAFGHPIKTVQIKLARV